MRISVIGAGYVGLTTSAGLASLGHTVRVGEIDSDRVAKLRSGAVPIFEAGLEEMLSEAASSGLVSFHDSNLDAIDGAELIFLCLPTPEGDGGRADLSFVEGVVDELAAPAGDAIFVIKSTVPPGTAAELQKRIADLGGAGRVVAHPEFLREGRAVADFLHPDRIVVGAVDPEDASTVASLYDPIDTEFVLTDPTSAEMIKYASNAYLATRLTMANTLANVCEAVGADIRDVLTGVKLDHRIGPYFLEPGPGYGGSCFPKDTAALIGVAADAGYDFQLLRAVIEADEEQRRRIVDKVRDAAGGSLESKVVALWGLAFKAGTDDVRESPAVRIGRLIRDAGAKVVVYDPEARSPDFETAESALSAVSGADVLLIATEWPEFAAVDPAEIARVMRGTGVVDARNILDPSRVREAGLDYLGLGRRLPAT
ncbi:MAG: UDP-glucose/GDP-mannose dehydrogenase family protein [Acidimicrobiia bacterium]|nr:UDP-glucose/GDP-mannose dehydrogenase family protein [Acidimicrobiia bacterium]